MTFDLIDDPTYRREHLSISIGYLYQRRQEGVRVRKLGGLWAVFYNGRVLHDGLHRNEVEHVRDMYVEGVAASDPRWKFLVTPGKQPSPNTDDRRRAEGEIR